MSENRMAPVKRWLLPGALFLLGTGAWSAWKFTDPRLAALRYQTGSSIPRGYILGISTINFFEGLHQSLPVIALICLFLSLTALLISWKKPALLGSAAVFCFSVLVYTASAAPNLASQSGAPHYAWLADAFANGRFVLEEEPPYPEENDWTYYNGQWMVSFPPAPALILTPIALFTGPNINDVVLTLIFGGLNVALFYTLMPLVGKRMKNKFDTTPAARLGLTLTFGFGTVHWWLSCFGQVWFTAQIFATTFLLLALYEALGPARPVWCGVWLALAALSRPPVLLALPVFLWLLCEESQPRQQLRSLLKIVAPLAAAGLFMGWYNYARFGNPFELGYRYMVLEELLADIVEKTGSFSLSYLKTNLYHAFLNLPELQARWPFVVMDGWGLSILLSTPLLLVLARTPLRERFVQVVLISTLLVALPSLLYYNTGYLQAGYRYSLDFLPLLFTALAAAMRGRFRPASWALAAFSIIVGFLSLCNFYILVFE